MKTNLKAAALAAALIGVATPGFAQSQLIANAGLTPAEAQGLSLTEVAAAYFNRSSGDDDQQRVLRPTSGVTVISRSVDANVGPQLVANAGLTPAEAQGLSLTEIAAAKFNRDASDDDQQRVERPATITVTSRSASGDLPQLAASAGLSSDEARGLSLTEIAAAKFARDTW